MTVRTEHAKQDRLAGNIMRRLYVHCLLKATRGRRGPPAIIESRKLLQLTAETSEEQSIITQVFSPFCSLPHSSLTSHRS